MMLAVRFPRLVRASEIAAAAVAPVALSPQLDLLMDRWEEEEGHRAWLRLARRQGFSHQPTTESADCFLWLSGDVWLELTLADVFSHSDYLLAEWDRLVTRRAPGA